MSALGWLLDDDTRADRFLSLTGLTPDDLRSGLTNPAILAAVLEFLSAHEPDLIAAAQSLGVEPQILAAASESLNQ